VQPNQTVTAIGEADEKKPAFYHEERQGDARMTCQLYVPRGFQSHALRLINTMNAIVDATQGAQPRKIAEAKKAAVSIV
jgi:hypothetical protein